MAVRFGVQPEIVRAWWSGLHPMSSGARMLLRALEREDAMRASGARPAPRGADTMTKDLFSLGAPVRVITTGPYHGRCGWITARRLGAYETVYLVSGLRKPVTHALIFFAEELEASGQESS
jgi:hypothetical protein